MMSHKRIYRQAIRWAAVLLLAVVFWRALPDPLFKDPYSLVIEDRHGRLLSAQIAADGQWRFPQIANVPPDFEMAITTFEDKRFHRHPGVDVVAIGRAVVQNMRAGRIESGASTLTMQVIRLSRRGKARTIFQKLIEAVLAVRLELSKSKSDILRLYASHAPFGGNVVGLEAASWRYFHKQPDQLSLAETATLAVLPNAPALIHPGKNRSALKRKRNRLLYAMYQAGHIDSLDYELSILEALPIRPHALPRLAPHLLDHIARSLTPRRLHTSINIEWQRKALDIAAFHHGLNVQQHIHNMGILVLDTKSGEVLAYVGNSPGQGEEHAVDMVQANRSSGSVLKPFLYAHMLEDGRLLPRMLIEDIPTQFGGFRPQNYDRDYTGMTPAHRALSKSLNVPAVRLLHEYGVERFIRRLQAHGLSTIDRSADHYGLSLIIGGAETNLWELCGAYASMGAVLYRFNAQESRYAHCDIRSPTYQHATPCASDAYFPYVLSAGSIYHTFEAMQQVMRPDDEGRWELFDSARKIAWKTGTSYGHRDAWAIGVTPQFTIGVWAGNADGEGVADLVGIRVAAPILFDVLNSLPGGDWFEQPIDDLYPVRVCRKSGHLAAIACDRVDTLFTLRQAERSKPCPYHRWVHVDDGGLRVHGHCSSPAEMDRKAWFVLPPTAAHYYRRDHPDYRHLPSYRTDCVSSEVEETEVLSFVYPTSRNRIFLPVDGDGQREEAVFQASHQDPEAVLFWHLDEQYLGQTSGFHSMQIITEPGDHIVTIMDGNGMTAHRSFEVIGR